MLSQLEFKLSVERQYKAGIEKMAKLYQDEGDRKSRAEAEGRRIESNQKIQLLQRALRRYTDLHVGVGEDDAADGKLSFMGEEVMLTVIRRQPQCAKHAQAFDRSTAPENSCRERS